MADYIDDLLQDPEKAQKALDVARGNVARSSPSDAEMADQSNIVPYKEQMATKEAPYNFARNDARQLASSQATGAPNNFSASDIPAPRSQETNDLLSQFGNKERMGKQLGNASPGYLPEPAEQPDLFDKSVNPISPRRSDNPTSGAPAAEDIDESALAAENAASKAKAAQSAEISLSPETKAALAGRTSSPVSDAVANIAKRFNIPVDAAKNFIAENPGFARTLGVLGTGAAAYGANKDIGDIQDMASKDTSNMSEQEKRNLGADIGGKTLSAAGNTALAGTGLGAGALAGLGWPGAASTLGAAGASVGLPLAAAGGAYQLGKYVNENGPEAITAMNEKNRTPQGAPPVTPDVAPPGQPGSAMQLTEQPVAPGLEHTNMVDKLYDDNGTSETSPEEMGNVPQKAKDKLEAERLEQANPNISTSPEQQAALAKANTRNNNRSPQSANDTSDIQNNLQQQAYKNPLNHSGVQLDNGGYSDTYLPPNPAIEKADQTGTLAPYSLDEAKKGVGPNRSPQSDEDAEAERRLKVFENTPEGKNIPPEDALLNYGPVANTEAGRAQYGKDTSDQAEFLQNLKDRYTESQNPTPAATSKAPSSTIPGILPASANIFDDVHNKYQQQNMGAPPAANPLQDYMDMMKTQSINNVAGLKDAQQRQTNAELAANLLRAGDIFSSGMATVGAHQIVKPSAQEAATALAAQAPEITKNYEALSEKEKDDPNSSYSQAMRSFMGPVMEKVGLKPNAFDGMSANQINAVAPWAIKINDSAEALEAKKELAREHNMMLSEHYANMDAAKNKTTTDKTAQLQNTAYEKMQAAIKSQRGSPALAQAATARQSIAKINDMFKTWGDPDKWSAQQVALYNQDVALVASNGRQATESTLKDTMPGGIGMNASKGLGKYLNTPVGAHQGDYIKQSKAYVDGIDNTLGEVLNHENGNTYNSYKRALAPEQQQEYLRNNPDVIPYTMFSPKQIQQYADNPNHKMSYDLAKKELQSKVEQDLYANP